MRRALFEDVSLKHFLSLPETKPALEYMNGRVLQKVSPRRRHSVIQSLLGANMLGYCYPCRLGIAYDELRCTYGGRSLVHDISYIIWGRIPSDDGGGLSDRVHLAPDLAIEVISPGQTLRAMEARLGWSIAKGVRLAWSIRPRAEQAMVFRPGRPVEILGRGQSLDGEAVIPGYRIELSEIFDWMRSG